MISHEMPRYAYEKDNNKVRLASCNPARHPLTLAPPTPRPARCGGCGSVVLMWVATPQINPVWVTGT